jgi:hypothetical protein
VGAESKIELLRKIVAGLALTVALIVVYWFYNSSRSAQPQPYQMSTWQGLPMLFDTRTGRTWIGRKCEANMSADEKKQWDDLKKQLGLPEPSASDLLSDLCWTPILAEPKQEP